MEGPLQHATAALVAGLPTTGASGNLGPATGAWGCGKRYAFPTPRAPRLLLRTNIQRGVTLTFRLVQNIGQVTISYRRGTATDTGFGQMRRTIAASMREYMPRTT